MPGFYSGQIATKTFPPVVAVHKVTECCTQLVWWVVATQVENFLPVVIVKRQCWGQLGVFPQREVVLAERLSG